VGQIGVVMPADPGRLRKQGDNLWTADGLVEEVPASGRVLQGFREGSSVEQVREMTEMIQAQRAYELNLRALRTQDETLGRAVNDVGRLTA
jgi:flagellar basal-body rod protein FlgG